MSDANDTNARPGAESPPLILFDGSCGLCDRSVAFVLARDGARRLHFAPLGSDYARGRLEEAGLDADHEDSVVLLEGERAWTKSGAALRIASHLRLPWSLARVFLVVPRFLRDWFYDFIARRRYRWFGRRESCRRPTPDEASRFHL